ncbi:MAG: 16S rRNA (cytosine(1402)-N(4))-methyltransferase RsmH, partial [Aliidongia sp.]
MTEPRHIPVLVEEVVLALAPGPDSIILDGTFGLGGYTRALLDASAGRVVGIDRDPQAIARGRSVESEFPGRISLMEGRFGEMENLLLATGITAVDGVALDLGVSSPQIDDPERGFSFRFDGPLDMRMGTDGPSAASLVNSLGEAELADIIWRFGEERLSRRVAK